MVDNKKEMERQALHNTIWNIANDLRGSVDGWDFKQYVLGMLFYRYISENITSYINKGEEEAAKKEDREALLLPHFSAHHLRHTFCTRLCENESNLKVIQSVMGHSDITTTMDIYAECTAEKKQEVFATLNGKIMIK